MPLPLALVGHDPHGFRWGGSIAEGMIGMAFGEPVTARPADNPARLAIPLTPRQRRFSGFAGGAALLAGGAAVFLTENELGSVALLTVGILFAFFALAGLLPTRLKLGDNEIEWQERVGEALREAVDEAPPESRAALIRTITELSASAPGLASQSLSGIAREALIMELLRAAIPPDVQWQSAVDSPDLMSLDAVVIDPNTQHRLGIEVKAYTKPLGGSVIYHLAGRFASLRKKESIDSLLLVTASPLTERAQEAAQEADILVVVASGPEDIPDVRHAILRGLQRPAAG